MRRPRIRNCLFASLLASALLLGPLASAGRSAAPVCMTGSDSDAAHVGGTGASLHYLTDVRAAGHPCRDRVVFEFEPRSDEGHLGYQVEYREGPLREEGRGRVVPVDGEAYLVVRLSPARDEGARDAETARGRHQLTRAGRSAPGGRGIAGGAGEQGLFDDDARFALSGSCR